MKDQLVSFETAKLAKEKGFPQNDLIKNGQSYSTYKNKLLTSDMLLKAMGDLENNSEIAKPTQSLLQKWLREEHSIHITIFSQSQESWMFRVTLKKQSLKEGLYGEDFYTYEEALEAGLVKALKMRVS